MAKSKKQKQLENHRKDFLKKRPQQFQQSGAQPKAGTVEIERSAIIAERLPTDDGWTFTLASRVSNIIRFGEQRFGKRNPTYKDAAGVDHQILVCGVEFKETRPGNWFPGSCGHMVLQLAKSALTDKNRAIYQLAHECGHVLTTNGGSGTNFLEEGMCEVLARDYTDFHRLLGPNGNRWTASDAHAEYNEAHDRVQALLKIDPEAIKKVRAKRYHLAAVTSDDLLAAVPGLVKADADELTKSFTG